MSDKKQAVWHTAQPRKERPIESHGRKSHGTQSIEPLRGGLTEGANAKVYMRTCIRAYTHDGLETTSHRLMVVNHWACNRYEGEFFCSEPLSRVENLSTAIRRTPPMSLATWQIHISKHQQRVAIGSADCHGTQHT